MEFFDFFEKSHFINLIFLKLSQVCFKAWKTWKRRKKFENRLSFANFSQFKSRFEKVGRGRDDGLAYLFFDIFWIYMLWGI
jgi:hypothetical protein